MLGRENQTNTQHQSAKQQLVSRACQVILYQSGSSSRVRGPGLSMALGALKSQLDRLQSCARHEKIGFIDVLSLK